MILTFPTNHNQADFRQIGMKTLKMFGTKSRKIEPLIPDLKRLVSLGVQKVERLEKWKRFLQNLSLVSSWDFKKTNNSFEYVIIFKWEFYSYFISKINKIIYCNNIYKSIWSLSDTEPSNLWTRSRIRDYSLR